MLAITDPHWPVSCLLLTPGASPGRPASTPAKNLAFSQLLSRLCLWVSVLSAVEWTEPWRGETATEPYLKLCLLPLAAASFFRESCSRAQYLCLFNCRRLDFPSPSGFGASAPLTDPAHPDSTPANSPFVMESPRTLPGPDHFGPVDGPLVMM